MSNTYLAQLDSHKLWIDSEGRLGEQLSLDEVDLNLFSVEQIKLFTDVFLSGCFLCTSIIIYSKLKFPPSSRGCSSSTKIRRREL